MLEGSALEAFILEAFVREGSTRAAFIREPFRWAVWFRSIPCGDRAHGSQSLRDICWCQVQGGLC